MTAVKHRQTYYGACLKLALERAGISVNTLSKKCGISTTQLQGYVSRGLRAGEANTERIDAVLPEWKPLREKIPQHLMNKVIPYGYKASEIAHLATQPGYLHLPDKQELIKLPEWDDLEPPPPPPEPHMIYGMVPLYSTWNLAEALADVKPGDDSTKIDEEAEDCTTGQPLLIARVAPPAQLETEEGLFAIEMNDDGMMPQIPVGSVVYASTQKPAKPGCLVVCEPEAEAEVPEATVRKFVRRLREGIAIEPGDHAGKIYGVVVAWTCYPG